MHNCLSVEPDALSNRERKEPWWRFRESTVISGEDKDYLRREAVCLSGAVIETGACLMCSDCYEFTDRLVGFIRICNIRKKERSLRPFPKKRQLWACVRADTRSLKGQLIAKNQRLNLEHDMLLSNHRVPRSEWADFAVLNGSTCREVRVSYRFN